jgi:hypothetical protein
LDFRSSSREGRRDMTRRELEIEAYSQKVFAEQAEQKAEDVGGALNLLLNGGFRTFHTTTTRDTAVHEFMVGIAKNVPVSDIFRWLWPSSQTEDRRIILWKTTLGSGDLHGSAYHEDEFRYLVHKAPLPELKELLEEAISKLSAETSPPDARGPRLIRATPPV